MKGLIFCLTILVCISIILGGCKKKEEDVIKIGALFSVTGPAAFLGEPEKKTAEMFVEELNSKGGINGKKVVLIVEDTEANPEKARAAALKLIEKEGVVAIIGPSTSGESLAIIETMNSKEVPNISCAAAETIVIPADPGQTVAEHRKWIFKVPQTDANCARWIFQCMNDLGLEKAGLLTGTSGFGKAGRSQLQKYAGEYGIEIVADETYDPADTSITAQLTKIKAAGADAVINWSIEPIQAQIAKQMQEVGLEAQLFQSHGYGNIRYAEMGGTAAEGTIFPAGRLLIAEHLPDTHAQKNVLMKYKRDYEKKFNEPVSTFGGHAYDALLILTKAIEAVGPDRAKIRDYIETMHGDNVVIGTAGIFNITPDDHCGLDMSSFELITVKDGKFVPYKEQ